LPGSKPKRALAALRGAEKSDGGVAAQKGAGMKHGAGIIMDKNLPDRFQGGEQQLLAAGGARLPIAGGDDEFAVRFRNGDEIIRLSSRRRTFQLWLDAEKSAELGDQTRVTGA